MQRYRKERGTSFHDKLFTIDFFSDILHEKRGNIQYKHGVTLAPPLLTKRNIQ